MTRSDFKLMGVLNVTPDSFFDGDAYPGVPAAAARADQILIDLATPEENEIKH